MRFFDTHAHLHYPDVPYGEVLTRARAAHVERMVSVSVDMPSMKEAQKIAEADPDVYFSCGLHPHEAKTFTPEMDLEIRSALKHPKAVGVGETGLDFYYGHSEKEQQFESFRAHIRIAQDVRKPLIVHCRSAANEIISILQESAPFPARGVIHCFTEDLSAAEQFIKLGFFISFAGIITFKNAETLREVARTIDLKHILIETDAPYLAPVPYRGKPNESAFVVEVAKQIASQRGVSVEEVARVTWENANKLFQLT